jgi:hypothetical protein
MVAKIALAVFLIGWPGFVAAQVVGDFYLEKPSYAIGEPILVYFQTVNRGTEPTKFYAADPNSECSAFHITVSNDEPSPSCFQAISCVSSLVVLQPGEKHIERILLNLAHKLDSPGEYSMTAEVRALDHDSKVESEPRTLRFQVEQYEVQPDALQPWVDQLRSHDSFKRREAALLLASVAPPFLEDTLLTFANDSDIRRFAPLAFHRLNTDRSMKAMVDLLKQTPGSFESWQASAYLAHDKCADATWSH